MATLILAFAVIALSLCGLAAGIMLGRAPLRGSCGGSTCDRLGACTACGRGRTDRTDP